MSIFKVLTDKDDTKDLLYQRIIYIMRADATENNYIYGAGISTYNPYVEMMMVKDTYQQFNGKAYFHYVLSIEETDGIALNELYKLGIQIAESIANFYGKYQVLMAGHFNVPKHLHIHFVANNIDYCTGKRLRLEKSKLYELKNNINAWLGKYDISEIRKFSYDKNDGKKEIIKI